MLVQCIYTTGLYSLIRSGSDVPPYIPRMNLNSVGSDQFSQNSVHPPLNYMMSDSNVQMMLAARYNVVKVCDFGRVRMN